ncbi:MAG: hypothetical protein ACFB50_10490 [Rubrobacteraceae bacterium]
MATRSADSIGNSEVFRAKLPAESHSAVHRFLIATLAWWALAALLVSGSGLFAQLPTPLLPIPVALGIFIPVLVYARSEAFRVYIHAADLRNLTLFHVWRVPAALAFFYYGAQGLLPKTFVFNAGWGDLVAGVLAPVVVFGLALGGLAYVNRVRRASFVGFHSFSIADFILGSWDRNRRCSVEQSPDGNHATVSYGYDRAVRCPRDRRSQPDDPAPALCEACLRSVTR